MALFFDLKTAAAECSVSIDTLKLAIEEGTLRAKRSGKAGGGKYLVTVAALNAWFETLVDA